MLTGEGGGGKGGRGAEPYDCKKARTSIIPYSLVSGDEAEGSREDGGEKERE